MLTVDDIEARWRPLTDPEKVVAATLVDDAIAWATVEVPSLEGRIATSPAVARNATRILANAVIRVLKNPEAYRQESDGSYSYTLDAAVSSGELRLTARDLRALAARGRSGSVSLHDPALPLIASPARGPRDPFREVE